MEIKKPYLAAVDISVLGTALMYRRHQTGVHRAFSELLWEFHQRKEIGLELMSVGRAPWLEFVSRIVFERNWKRADWVFRSRETRLPGLYRALLVLSRIALFAKEKDLLSEKILAGFFQVLGACLRPGIASFSAKVYYSPAHALPNLPEGVQRCITLYDMIPVKFPQWYDESESFRKIIRSIDINRDFVASISECSREDWLEHSGMTRSRTQVIPIGVSEIFFPCENRNGQNRILKKYGVTEGRMLLAVGTLEPRKNLETLVRAFFDLKEDLSFSDVVLLLIGPKGWKNDALFELLNSRPEIGKSVRLAGFVPDEDLPWLYSACEFFIFPSLYEGFGLPVAEAMKCGAAVICGRHSSLPEVAGEAAEYVDVRDAKALRKCIANLLSNPDRIRELKSQARKRGALFNWKATGDAYLALFKELTEPA